MLEEKLVELEIKASDSTLGRVLKKLPPASSPAAMGYCAARQQRLRRGYGGGARGLSKAARPKLIRWSVLTKPAGN